VSDQVAALQHVLTLALLHADKTTVAAVNMSLGLGEESSACEVGSAREAAVNALRNAGIAVVAASGNETFSDGINAPACIASVTAVGATQDDDKIWFKTNMADNVDLMAPGVNIRSAIPGDKIGSKNGTSMATPHVAGAFALLRQARPDASVDEIEAVLGCTGVPVSRRIPGSDEKIVKPRIALASAHKFLTGKQTPFRWTFDSAADASDWLSFAGDKTLVDRGAIRLRKIGTNPVQDNEANERNEILSRIKNCFSRFVVNLDVILKSGAVADFPDVENPPVDTSHPSSSFISDINHVQVYLHAASDPAFGLTTGYTLDVFTNHIERQEVGDLDGDVEFDDWHVGSSQRASVRLLRTDIQATGDPAAPFQHVETGICPDVSIMDVGFSVTGNVDRGTCGGPSGPGDTTCITTSNDNPFRFRLNGRNSFKFMSDGQRTTVKINDVKFCEFSDRKFLFGRVGIGFGSSTHESNSIKPRAQLDGVEIRALKPGESID
jgi:hypothetical protein